MGIGPKNINFNSEYTLVMKIVNLGKKTSNQGRPKLNEITAFCLGIPSVLKPKLLQKLEQSYGGGIWVLKSNAVEETETQSETEE